jgi:hypothetical protein
VTGRRRFDLALHDELTALVGAANALGRCRRFLDDGSELRNRVASLEIALRQHAAYREAASHPRPEVRP